MAKRVKRKPGFYDATKRKPGRMTKNEIAKAMGSPIATTDGEANVDQKNIAADVLFEAGAGVLKDRQAIYGSPSENLSYVASLINGWTLVRNQVRGYTTPMVNSQDVAVMQIMTRLARLAKTPDHFDSWVDIAGYAACGAEVTGARKK